MGENNAQIKNSLVFLFIGSLFTQEAHLSFGDVSLAIGVYFLTLMTTEYVSTQKLMLLK
tara:strand:- start:220 stop:396 length:177 start_codon:yes stop_codon:yes gene_type:complete